MTKKTSIVLLCLITVVVLFFGIFAFIPDGLEFGEYNKFYSPYTLIQKSSMFGDYVEATYQLKLDEGTDFNYVKSVLKSRLEKVYGYYSVDITEKDGVVTINMPQTADTRKANADSILSSITQQGKLEILSTVYPNTGEKPSYDEKAVVLTREHLRGATTRNYSNNGYTYYICQAKLTGEGAELVKEAKLVDGTMYCYAVDETIVFAAAYQNGQFQIYGSNQDSSRFLASVIRTGSLNATLTRLDMVDVNNTLGWLFAVIMGVVVLATFVFFAVRYKTLGIAGILSQLIAVVLFMYSLALIYMSIFNLFAAIGVVLAYAFMTFFTIFTFERIRAKAAEKTFAAAAYQGFKSTNIISLIAHGAFLVLGIILWVIPTAVTAPIGTVLVFGAILSFAATFGLNRLFAQVVIEPFYETSGKSVAKK